MEKPAVIFSEQGFKMFADLIRDLTAGQQIEAPDGNSVDALVKEYFARDDRPDLTPLPVEPPKPNTLYDMDDVATAIAEELGNNKGTVYNSTELAAILVEAGFQYTAKGAVAVMRGVMKRFPQIVKVDAGLYAWRVNDNE